MPIDEPNWSDPVPAHIWTLLGFELKSYGQYGMKWTQELPGPLEPLRLAEGSTWYELCHALGAWQYNAYGRGLDTGVVQERARISALFNINTTA